MNTFSTYITLCLQVYDEIDDEVLQDLRKKMEVVRSGKAIIDPNTVVVDYVPSSKNIYTLEESVYAELERGNPAEHVYEDIHKDFEQRHAAESMYQNLSNAEVDDQNTHAVDKIYESLPGYRECQKG